MLEQAKLPFAESDLLVVQLPDGPQPLLQIFKVLLVSEINIDYAYRCSSARTAPPPCACTSRTMKWPPRYSPSRTLS